MSRQTIKGYYYDEKEDEIGSGAFATIFRARHIQDPSNVVAIKMIDHRKGPAKTMPMELKEREVEICKAILKERHKNLVSFKDYEVNQNATYVVMEFCDGGDFRGYLDDKKTLSESVIQQFFRQIADFGVSRFLSSGDVASTVCGTIVYMAPEILNRELYTKMVDVWSIGEMVHECLSGREPRPPFRNFELPAQTSKEIRALLQKLMAQKAQDRLNCEQILKHQFMSATNQRIVQAAYDHDSRRNDDLGFRKGDRMHLLKSNTDVDKKYHTHCESNRYSCKWTDFRKPGASGVAKWLFERSRAAIPKQEELDQNLPVINPSFDKYGSEATMSGICVTWLGHACVLVQIDAMKILTDPVFSSRCGPKFGLQIGYTRYREAPCSVETLPDIDAVIISNNHYDHLDYDSVYQLAERFRDLKWFVPMGVKAFMESCQCKNVEECMWWQGRLHANVRFTFVPAQYWSKRGLMDDNMSLWGGWCIKGSQRNFYFSGDTGYDGELFKEIGDKLGPFDLAAIPIGAYCPRWLMQQHHIDPEEALKVHEDVKATRSIGIHWGTFNMSAEPYLEPRDKVKELQIKKIIEILLIKVITESLQTEKYEELQREHIQEWVRKKIEKLQNGKKEELQTEEKIKEWLCKELGELLIEKIEQYQQIKNFLRAIIEELQHEIIELQKEKIDEWLKKKIEELLKMNEIELWDGGNFFTINIGETKFIKSQQ